MDRDFELWERISNTLDTCYPTWRARIDSFGQVKMIENRENGCLLEDNEIFAGVVKAVLSGATDWSRIENILPDLSVLFKNYDLHYYSSLSQNDIDDVLLPWFLNRYAGGLTLRQNLLLLVKTAKELRACIKQYGSLEKYFSALFRGYGDPISVTHQLGSSKSPRKLPALGIPIAAEMMKNIGYDVAKPDRHLNRALGCLRRVSFANWKDKSKNKAPLATEDEMIEVMKEMDRFAITIGERVALLDNAIWMLCAKSGMGMCNSDLSRMI